MVCMLALSAALISPVVAQYVYPVKGQSAQQQKSDEAACYQWAVTQTGFDPAKPPPQAAPAPTTASGSIPGADVRGAVGGAVIVVGRVIVSSAATTVVSSVHAGCCRRQLND
jgi:hypothetical protein